MNSVKRILAFILAMVMVFSIPSFAFAAKASKTEETEVTEETAEAAEDSGETTEAPVKERKKIKLLPDKVANIYLLVSEANPKLPHVWIYIENISDHTLQLGHYTLPAGESVSMGAWKDRGNGAGIHYNLERYWVKEATYGRTVYIKATLTDTEVKMISGTINVHDYWSWPFNCGWFATSVWNKGTLKQVPYLFFPRVIKAIMYLWGAKKLDFTIVKLNNAGKVYKHTSSGVENVVLSGLWTKTGV